MMTLWTLAATLLFLAAFGGLVLRWLAFSGAEIPAPFSDPLPSRIGKKPERTDLWKVFLAALLFRLALALGSLLLYNALSGGGVGLGGLPELWSRWDAPHYIKLVELGYGGYLEDGQPLFLVFYPLYVWITRAFALVIPDTALVGMAVSFLCFAWGCVYLYRLAAEEYGAKAARRTLVLLWAYPFSFFFGGIMTESLFLLTTAAGLYHIRRHQWGRAAVWGFLAALTRMQGVLLVGAAAAELVNGVKPFRHRGGGQGTGFPGDREEAASALRPHPGQPGLFRPQRPRHGGSLRLHENAGPLEPGLPVVPRGAGVSGEKRPDLAQRDHPVGDVDPGAAALSCFRPAAVAELEKAPEHVYPVRLRLFYPELLPLLAFERRALPLLRGALLPLRRR